MRISVFGMGYVGCVTAAALSRENHVIGVDVNRQKVETIRRGEAPVLESGLNDLVAKSVRLGKLTATDNGVAAVLDSDLSLVCVGTPANKNGSFDYRHLISAVTEVGAGIKGKNSRHVVAIRSTVLPGTTESMLIPELEKASGKKTGKDFSVHTNPEFLRESSALYDFDNPPFVVIGNAAGCDGAMFDRLYAGTGPIYHTSIKTAEMLKYVCNSYHAIKITFANEIGSICKAIGVDSHEVMDLFCQDTKLNVSSAYLKPGFAYGGSCLPKDLRALNYQAQTLDLQLPLLASINQSNQLQIQRAIDYVVEIGAKKIGLLGLTFKAGTDDLRESPLVRLCEALIGKGIDMRIYDPNLVLSKLVGANKAYIEEQLPHIQRLLCETFDQLAEKTELLILGNRYSEFRSKLLSLDESVQLFDLVHFFGAEETPRQYRGICW
jgi:GDP-mannose 6-dehydrogenase